MHELQETYIFFILKGVLTKIGGVRKFRKISDVNSAISGVDKAFGDAIDGAKRQSKKSSGAGCKYDLILFLLIPIPFIQILN